MTNASDVDGSEMLKQDMAINSCPLHWLVKNMIKSESVIQYIRMNCCKLFGACNGGNIISNDLDTF